MHEVVKAIIYKKGRYLLQLRDRKPSISYPDTWSFFGGGVDDRESHIEALQRELEEELSWRPKKIQYFTEIKNKTENCNQTYFIAYCDISENKLLLGEGQ